MNKVKINELEEKTLKYSLGNKKHRIDITYKNGKFAMLTFIRDGEFFSSNYYFVHGEELKPFLELLKEVLKEFKKI